MKILIAEKDEDLRMLTCARLGARDYEILEAKASEDTLKILEREPVDVILLSDQMESVGGKLLIEILRQKPNLMAVPILLLTSERKIAELLMSQERGFDDFLIRPFSSLVLQLRVAINISRARQRAEANALTHLPGNHGVERVIREKIERGEKFSVLYIDINHFKSFNDRYGFEKGDDVIRQTAKILLRTAEVLGPDGRCFVGHIGGDDFVVILGPEDEELYARTFISEFDRIIPTYYHEEDRRQGSVRVPNRQGKPETFPLMSCAVAACNNLYRSYQNLGEIAQDTAEVKSFLKSQPGSHYLRDRRSSPIQELEEAMEILAPEMEPKKAEEHPLGQVLRNAGLISEEQLSLALKRHLETGRRLGQVLIAMKMVRSEDVGKMLEKKLRVPYVSFKYFKPSREALRIFRVEFMKAHRVVPLERAGGRLRIGMCDPFDVRTIDTVERITRLSPVPCLILEDEFEDFLERELSQTPYPVEET